VKKSEGSLFPVASDLVILLM